MRLLLKNRWIRSKSWRARSHNRSTRREVALCASYKSVRLSKAKHRQHDDQDDHQGKLAAEKVGADLEKSRLPITGVGYVPTCFVNCDNNFGFPLIMGSHLLIQSIKPLFSNCSTNDVSTNCSGLGGGFLPGN
jgi:hypothetical protein